ncbi:MAG: hypothetical protein H8D23_23640 [Candidatus Brocadiales bacterium]|nr:hypothetical protein [Candidatus Brocadiales bacterium]
MANYISLSEIAEEVGVEISTVRRAIKRSGNKLDITVEKQKSSKGGWANCISAVDAEKLISYLESRKKLDIEDNENDFFSQMPGPESEKVLSEHSPLNMKH